MNLSSHNTAGFALLEVLVAVLIISFGLLGLAGLQGTALKNNHSAYLRSLATQFSYDIADRIRANAATDYASAVATNHSQCPNATPCTPQELAEDDMNTWINAVNAALPTLASDPPQITKDPTTGVYTVTIKWDDSRSGTANVAFSTSFKP
jgi:type IV pilus assembly protein PilV